MWYSFKDWVLQIMQIFAALFGMLWVVTAISLIFNITLRAMDSGYFAGWLILFLVGVSLEVALGVKLLYCLSRWYWDW